MSVHHLTFRVNTHNQEYQETQKGMEILRFYDNFHLFDYDTSFVLYSVSYGNTFFKWNWRITPPPQRKPPTTFAKP